MLPFSLSSSLEITRGRVRTVLLIFENAEIIEMLELHMQAFTANNEIFYTIFIIQFIVSSMLSIGIEKRF